ncbi:hypothetical protein, partial [Escherichia coli]|uniref:hypothetical protein n=1 Tax=Escherichia coli TaxID=562 RepID=UPI001BC8D271
LVSPIISGDITVNSNNSSFIANTTNRFKDIYLNETIDFNHNNNTRCFIHNNGDVLNITNNVNKNSTTLVNNAEGGARIALW